MYIMSRCNEGMHFWKLSRAKQTSQSIGEGEGEGGDEGVSMRVRVRG